MAKVKKEEQKPTSLNISIVDGTTEMVFNGNALLMAEALSECMKRDLKFKGMVYIACVDHRQEMIEILNGNI